VLGRIIHPIGIVPDKQTRKKSFVAACMIKLLTLDRNARDLCILALCQIYCKYSTINQIHTFVC